MIVSEGATWKEGTVAEYGEADAYGHRKKVDIGEALGEEIRRRTGDEIMISDLTYDLRSGEPDAIDQLVAITYREHRGRDDGRRRNRPHGCGTRTAATRTRRCRLLRWARASVDLKTMYNTERYRPSYASKLGAPLLFNHI